MRVFVSVDLPPSLVDAVESVQAMFAKERGLRFTDPTQAHITMKFLGEVPESLIPEITTWLSEAIDELTIDPFSATIAGLGAFPSTDYIRVIWLGITNGHDDLMHIQEVIERKAITAGFDAEQHDFTPHITIARMEHAADKANIQAILEDEDPHVGTMTVDAVALTKSTLGENGPVYSTIKRFEL